MAADVCSAERLRGWATSDVEYLAFCGVVGLGRLVADGDESALTELRGHADDPRWRVREAVAMALQRWGARDFDALAAEMLDWARGSALQARAAGAALCEPALLTDPTRVEATLAVLEEATHAVESAAPRSGELKALRKGLGYCWSVAVAAAPEVGRPAFEALVERARADSDLRWIAKENLRKRRLERMDPAWVERLREGL